MAFPRGTAINLELLVEGLLSLENRILFVGVVDSSFKLRHSAFREGTKLHADPQVVRNFMTLAPRLAVSELEKIKPILGPISSVLVRYEKRLFVFCRLEDYVIVMGLGTEVSTPLPDHIARIVQTAAGRARVH